MGPTRGLRRRKYANGSKVPRATRTSVRQGQHHSAFSTVTSYTNPLEAGKPAMRTRGIAAIEPRDAVFNTYELLEKILLSLSLEDVLTARHVNHHWNHLILNTPRLLRHLGMHEAPRYPFWTFDTQLETLRRFKAGDIERFGEAWAKRQNMAIPAVVSPVFKENSFEDKGSLVHRAKYCEDIRFKAVPDITNDGSIFWDMYLSMPAPQKAEFVIYYHKKRPRGKGRYYGDGHVRSSIENKLGVTLRDVIEEFLTVAGRRAMASESVSDFVICTDSSRIWMMGIIFPTKDEYAMMEALSV